MFFTKTETPKDLRADTRRCEARRPLIAGFKPGNQIGLLEKNLSIGKQIHSTYKLCADCITVKTTVTTCNNTNRRVKWCANQNHYPDSKDYMCFHVFSVIIGHFFTSDPAPLNWSIWSSSTCRLCPVSLWVSDGWRNGDSPSNSPESLFSKRSQGIRRSHCTHGRFSNSEFVGSNIWDHLRHAGIWLI